VTLVSFALEKEPKEGTGTLVDSVVKYTADEVGKTEREVWCSVDDLDSLFAACVDRWGKNWNLEKVVTAIKESEID
jgi:hypothetical protein